LCCSDNAHTRPPDLALCDALRHKVLDFLGTNGDPAASQLSSFSNQRVVMRPLDSDSKRAAQQLVTEGNL
jgi:hypothetical protein